MEVDELLNSRLMFLRHTKLLNTTQFASEFDISSRRPRGHQTMLKHKTVEIRGKVVCRKKLLHCLLLVELMIFPLLDPNSIEVKSRRHSRQSDFVLGMQEAIIYGQPIECFLSYKHSCVK